MGIPQGATRNGVRQFESVVGFLMARDYRRRDYRLRPVSTSGRTAQLIASSTEVFGFTGTF